MTDIIKPWYAHDGTYPGKYPPFSDLEGIAWYNKLKHDLPDIKEKITTFMKIDGVDIKNVYFPDRIEGTGWATVPFMFWKARNKEMIIKGIDVFEYFKDIPGFTSLAVSILKPNTRLKAHTGDTDAVYRIHIPIYIPAQLPYCGITVAGITKPWMDNEMIVFCDAYLHEAWNMTDKPRIVLILDVVKEEFLPQTDKICATVTAAMKYYYIAGKLGFLKNIHKWIPKWIKNIIRKMM